MPASEKSTQELHDERASLVTQTMSLNAELHRHRVEAGAAEIEIMRIEDEIGEAGRSPESEALLREAQTTHASLCEALADCEQRIEETEQRMDAIIRVLARS